MNSRAKLNQVDVYYYGATAIKTLLLHDGSPWFVAQEICAVLDMAHTGSAIRYLDDDEKDVLNQHTPGGTQKVSIISESGLYALIMRSRKPEAKKFRKWVTSEVLPAIRKTGSYQAPSQPAQKFKTESQRRLEAAAIIEADIKAYRQLGAPMPAARRFAIANALAVTGVDYGNFLHGGAAIGSDIEAFVMDCCDTERADAFSRRTALHDAYRRWAETAGRPALGRNQFYAALHAALPWLRRTRVELGGEKCHGYFGICIGEGNG